MVVFVLAAGAATLELTTELGAEYFAMYVLEPTDFGASKRDPSTLNAQLSANEQKRVVEGDDVPLLLASVNAKQKAPTVAEGLTESLPKPISAEKPLAHEKSSDLSPKDLKPAPEMIAEVRGSSADSLMALIGDTPHRRLNGTVFLPIAAQRVFGLRTVLGERVRTPVVTEFSGRIVRNPASSSLIQVREDGYIETAGEQFPFVGQKVKRGQLLAYLKPAFDHIEEAKIEERVQALISDINLARKRMARLEEVIYVRYRLSKIEAIRTEIEGLQERLAVFQNSLIERDELRARTDGVISRIVAHVGQFVHTGGTIFEIVDPSRLWVEADAYDHEIAAHIASASGMTTDGQALELKFLGGGRSLRNQAVPLYFEILNLAPSLAVENPVTVVAQSDAGQISGVKVPRQSVLRTSEGQEIIWERRSAEIFVAHHVSPMPIDAENVLIPSKLGAGTRVVTQGAAVLNQIR